MRTRTMALFALLASVVLIGAGCVVPPTPQPEDLVPPVLALPADITVPADDANGASVDWTATALDEVDGPVAVTCVPPPGVFPIGTTAVSCNATDAAGNAATSGFDVTVAPLPSGDLSVVAGGSHSCAVVGDATVRCWGDNSVGQLGTGNTTSSELPVTVPSLTGVVAVATGERHSCAVLGDGTVRCWGDNAQGRLGNGSTTSSSTPVLVSGLTGVVDVTAGDAHTCALLANGAAECWGHNGSGRLGNGDGVNPVTTPEPVAGNFSNFVAVRAGGAHTCAALSDGTARCWGENSDGQLGVGNTTDWNSPLIVSGLNDVVDIDAAGNHSCAVLGDGTARCWGDNPSGQLGTGTLADSYVPIPVVGLSSAESIATGRLHTCALVAGGTARCWGDSAWGQLGNGTYGPGSTSPVAVSNIAGATTIDAGSSHTCVVLGAGTPQCWGNNLAGRLGNGTNGYISAEATDVGGLSAASGVTAGTAHSCATRSDGTIYCWGGNASGQLGRGSIGGSSVVPAVVATGIVNAQAVAAGANHTCAVLTDTTARCWGNNSAGQLGVGNTTTWGSPLSVTGVTTAVAVAAGTNHSCVVLVDGTVRCWGNNDAGQLGNGSSVNSSVPVTVLGVTTATAITAGDRHTCAVLADTTVRCWGHNSSGQLGNGSTTTSFTQVPVSGLTGAVDIAAGHNHTCAVLADGSAHCWGSNTAGQLADGSAATSSTVPTTVSGVSDGVEVAANGNHTCVRVADGTVLCAGSNRSAQLGNGATGGSTNDAAEVVELADATAVAAGSSHSCAVITGGTVRCWGRNDDTQLGSRAGFPLGPTPVVGLS